MASGARRRARRRRAPGAARRLHRPDLERRRGAAGRGAEHHGLPRADGARRGRRGRAVPARRGAGAARAWRPTRCAICAPPRPRSGARTRRASRTRWRTRSRPEERGGLLLDWLGGARRGRRRPTRWWPPRSPGSAGRSRSRPSPTGWGWGSATCAGASRPRWATAPSASRGWCGCSGRSRSPGPAGTRGWSEVAFAAGYADQSHLVNDCRALAGCRPRSSPHSRFLQDGRRPRAG